MKKAYFLLVAAVALLSAQSCRKCDMDDRRPVITNQSIDTSINENTTYTYTLSAYPLPVVANGPGVQVTTAPTHAALSTVTTDANGNLVYQYIPVANYVGTDVVVITAPAPPPGALPGGQGNCNGGGHGNCNNSGQGCHHPAPQVVTTINLTINPTSTSVTATRQSAGITARQNN